MEQATDRAFDSEKFKELVLYIAEQCEEDLSFGATKLNKILFYADFLSYGEHGRSITGATYMPLEWGPAPRQWLPAKQELRREGAIEIQRRRHYGFRQDRVVALREADLSAFSPQDLDTVHFVLDKLQALSAGEASDASHQEVGWQMARRLGWDEIPYSTVFLSNRPLTPEDIAKGRELAEELGLLV